MKRRISLLLALVIVLGSFGTAFAAVPETAVDKAKFLETKGILKGSTKGDLMLEKEETRQNMVVMLSRLMGQADEAKAHGVEEAAKFEDITDGLYRPYIAWSVAKGYTIGQSETKFGAKANVTVQEYSIVLLRALGYFDTKDAKAEYENAFNVAKQLGLLEDTKIEDEKAVLTRDQMSVMIYNALETNVKGTEETLAQKLGIEMPKEDKPQELKVESVRANNLGEIEVTVSNGKLLDQANVKNTDNYRLGYKSGTNVKVNKVLVNEDVITLELDGELDNNAKYDLVIRNMNKTNKGLNGSHEFTTKDNVKPVVEKAEYLGKNGIKVTMSEPVGKVAERSFLVDGKNVVMNVEAYGREIILTPYGKASFDKDMKELTVRPFKDFAGILSDEKTVKIDSVEDYEKAPVVKAIVAKGNKVIVTFDKDIYNDSVEAYKDSKNKGNIEYFVRGRHAAYATKATKIDTNVVEYEFERTLSDRFTKVEITGVKNHDDVTMEKHIEEELELVVDRSEPIVIKKDVAITGKDSATVEIFFDKDMDGFKDGESVKEIKNHFRLFQTGLNDLRDQDITNKSIKSAVYTGTDSVKVTLENLPLAGKFILEVENFEDNTVIKNRMFREYIDIELRKAPGTLNVTDVKVMRDRNENRIKEIEVIFDQKLDRISAENARNYTLITKDNISYDLDQLKTDVVIELDNNGKRVNLVFVDPILEAEYQSIIISNRIKGLKDERLTENHEYVFGELDSSFVARLNKAVEDAEDLSEEATAKIKEALDFIKAKENRTLANKADLQKNLAIVEKAIEEAKKAEDEKVAEAKEKLKAEIEKAKEVLKENPANKELDLAIKAAEAVVKDEKATKDLVEKAKEDLEKAVDAK